MSQESVHQVPGYNVEFWGGRQHKYCVVIPVINEGSRITDLLTSMSMLNVSESSDIIIMDGGSVDGSLSQDKLLQLKVKGLLVKTGPGKLSAQLRCAYDFAITEGYEGVITIDGNNKDDPDTITDFIAALESGVDFAQASRYIKGGKQVNTPFVRNFAIRLIHAPLLSLASGFHWTDTTQGFRAYSRRLLTSEKVSVFRDVFRDYELLAYLSYIAPRLGFKCKELPTTRRYPKGKVPTKITAFRGNIKLMQTLLNVCLGRYNIS